MKLAWFAAALLASIGCEKAESKLDPIAKSASAKAGGTGNRELEARIAALEQKLGKVKGEALEALSYAFDKSAQTGQPGVSTGPALEQDLLLGRIGVLEQKVGVHDQKLAKVDSDALEFLAAVYEQQLERETRPQPGVVYGVDIQQNLQLGHVEGSPDALVTIVEAWDFA